MKTLFWLLIMCLVCSYSVYSFEPVTVDTNTIGLWNFDGETGNLVYDQGVNGINGNAINVLVVSGIPDLDVQFAEARQIVGDGFIDLGEIIGSPLDLSGAIEANIEALIYITSSASGQHIIFSSEQMQLMIINNYLAAFVQQTGGKFGVVSKQALALNTTYRVMATLGNGKLGIFVNGRSHGLVDINEPLALVPYSYAHGFIGGNMFAESFVGFIDDVRFSNISRGDVLAPEIELVLPQSSAVDEAKPDFEFHLSDVGTGIDVSSIRIYLNGVLQTGLTITQSSITGKMSDDLLSSSVNHVMVHINDNVGNETEKSFYFNFANILSGTEYETDEYTLGLWHMNDFVPEIMVDYSGHAVDGFGVTGQVAIGDGVFSKGRYFQGTADSKITLKSALIPGNQFTFETWIMPTADQYYAYQHEYIFYNGQISITRYAGGHIRISFLQARNSKIFESAISLLPVGELHHLAITWDGSLESDNLLIYIDSGIMQKFDAPFECDFAPIPVVGIIGPYFYGMLDEMRFSSVVRDGFNMPTFGTRIIDFLTLSDGTSTNTDFPQLQVMFNSDTTIDPAHVKIRLNDVLQPASANLLVTSSNVNGTMTDAAKLGLNIIEVEFIDNNGNQKKKKQYFYYIKKNVGQQYAVDEHTLGLWHFSIDAKDSTDNGYNLVDPASTAPGPIEDAVIGNAWSDWSQTQSNVIDINSKEFTIEGWFKNISVENRFWAAMQLDSSQFNANVEINFYSGDVRVSHYNPDFNINQVIPAVFPTDGQYHHIALVYNGCQNFAQMLLVIDGEVKKTFNAPSYCRVLDPVTLQVAYATSQGNIRYDEIRISNKARYDFNIGELIKPTKLSFTPDRGQTIHTSNLNASFSVMSLYGISLEETYVRLNGSVESGVNIMQSGQAAIISGILNNLIPGTNLIQIFVNDNHGNQQEFVYYFYVFTDGGVSEYTEDSNTLGLWHINENSGNILNDSSGNGNYLDMEGAWSWGNGILGTAGVNPNNVMLTTPISISDNFINFTIEGWFQATPDNATVPVFGFGSSNLLYSMDTDIYLDAPILNGSVVYIRTMSFAEGFHHIAIVADVNQPYRNYYLLIDGEVIFATKLSTTQLTLNTLGNFSFGGRNTIDEIRFSDIARYALNFRQAKK